MYSWRTNSKEMRSPGIGRRIYSWRSRRSYSPRDNGGPSSVHIWKRNATDRCRMSFCDAKFHCFFEITMRNQYSTEEDFFIWISRGIIRFYNIFRGTDFPQTEQWWHRSGLMHLHLSQYRIAEMRTWRMDFSFHNIKFKQKRSHTVGPKYYWRVSAHAKCPIMTNQCRTH